MIDNTIPILDRILKAAIPTLAIGIYIVYGHALSMTVLIQVNKLIK